MVLLSTKQPTRCHSHDPSHVQQSWGMEGLLPPDEVEECVTPRAVETKTEFWSIAWQKCCKLERSMPRQHRPMAEFTTNILAAARRMQHAEIPTASSVCSVWTKRSCMQPPSRMKSSILDDGQMTAILQTCACARRSGELPYSAPKMTPAHTAVPSGRRINTALLMKSSSLATILLQKRHSNSRHRYHNHIGAATGHCRSH